MKDSTRRLESVSVHPHPVPWSSCKIWGFWKHTRWVWTAASHWVCHLALFSAVFL